MSYSDWQRVPENQCKCGHYWWEHGDGLDQDRHRNCEIKRCDCKQYDDVLDLIDLTVNNDSTVPLR